MCRFFWYLFFLVFYELPGSVVWYLSLIFRNPYYCFKWCLFSSLPPFLSFFLPSFLLSSPYTHVIPYVIVSQFLVILLCNFHFKNLFGFQFWRTLSMFLQVTDSFLGCVQSIDELIKGILHFYYIVLHF